jgi:hypothetical protein
MRVWHPLASSNALVPELFPKGWLNMAHKIMGSRFIARSKPAWHNIAKRIFGESEVITAREAMVEVAGDIEVVRAPLTYRLDGVEYTADNKTAIIRKATQDDPKPLVLGITSEAWVASSYADLAGALDGLSKQYKVETAGLLEDGGLAFLCFRAEDWAVKGDEMRSYFAANFSLTPGVGHKIFHSPVRVVCWNTNTMAQGQASINLSIPHSADAMQRIQLATRLVTQFHEMKDKAKEIFEAFADKQVTAKDVDSILFAAFQLPNLPPQLRLLKQSLSETEAEVFKRALTPDLLIGLNKAQEQYDRQCDNVLELRKVALERFEAFNPPNLRGTVWAAYNAATEVSDWREGRGADQSALFGGRAAEKGRAYEAAMALVAR